MKVPRVFVMRRSVQPQAGESFEEDAQGSLHFEPGEGSSHAKVDSGAEADMRVRRPRGKEMIGVGEFVRIAVG